MKSSRHGRSHLSIGGRHAFTTDALVKGVGVAQVAELLGHTSTDMVKRHYAKLGAHVAHMRDAAAKAAG